MVLENLEKIAKLKIIVIIKNLHGCVENVKKNHVLISLQEDFLSYKEKY